MPVPIRESLPLGRRAGHAWINDSVHQAPRRTNALRAARQPPRGRRGRPRLTGRTGQLRARAQACARSRIARRAERRPRSPSRHWHTPPPLALHRAAGARREGGRPVRVVVAQCGTNRPRSLDAAATARVAVDHGARLRAQHAPPPAGSLPSHTSAHLPPCGSAAADSSAGQVDCRRCAARRCGRCGTSTRCVAMRRASR